jgi:hypothetical protein
MATITSSPKTPVLSIPREFSEDEKTIIKEVQKKFYDADNFRFNRVGNKFEEGNTYIVEFITKDRSKNMSWYYAYIDKTECLLFDDGDETIVYMQNLLEKRRSFLQRLRDFDFLDIVGALIAFPIIIAFVYIVVLSKGGQNAVSKELLTIVSLILGYYFGRNKTK